MILMTQDSHCVFHGGLLALLWFLGMKLVSLWTDGLLKHILGFSFILKESSLCTWDWLGIWTQEQLDGEIWFKHLLSIWNIILMMLYTKNSADMNITYVHIVYHLHGSWADMCIAVVFHLCLRQYIWSLQGTARPRIQLLLRDRVWQVKLWLHFVPRRHCVLQHTSLKHAWSRDHKFHCCCHFSGNWSGDND